MKVMFLLILIIPSVVFSSDYDDCILKNMRGSNSNSAAYQVAQSCRNITTPNACKGNNFEMYKKNAIKIKQIKNSDRINQLKNEEANLKNSNNSKYVSTFYPTELEQLNSMTDEEVLADCLDYCKNQDLFTRKFGECKTDW